MILDLRVESRLKTHNAPIRLSLSRLKIERTRSRQPSNRAKAFIRPPSVT